MDMPYFPFYPGDWLSDPNVQFLSLEESGAYITLLAYMWRDGKDCALTDDDTYLARLLHVSTRKWAKLREILIDGEHAVLKKTSDGLIRNNRLDEEWKKVNNTSKSRAIAAKVRWDNEKKYHANGMQTVCKSNANASGLHMQNDAISDPESESDPDKHIKDRRILGETLSKLFPHGMSSTAQHDIFEYMDKGLELELLSVAYQISVSKNARDKPSYTASVLRGFLNDKITTVAGYQAVEAQRESAAGSVNYELTANRQSGVKPGRTTALTAAEYAKQLIAERGG